MFDVSRLSGISGLSFDSTFSISSFVLLLTPVALSVLFSFFLLILSPYSFFAENSSTCFVEKQVCLFLYGSLFCSWEKLVGRWGNCNMLPYGTGICCYIYIYVSVHSQLFLSIPSLYLKQSGINTRRKSRQYQRVLALCVCLFVCLFFNRGNIELIISSKILYSMFVRVCFVSYFCRD